MDDTILSATSEKTLIEFILLGRSVNPSSEERTQSCYGSTCHSKPSSAARRPRKTGHGNSRSVFQADQPATDAEKTMAGDVFTGRKNKVLKEQNRQAKLIETFNIKATVGPSEKSGCAVARFAGKVGNRWSSIGVESAIAMMGKNSSVLLRSGNGPKGEACAGQDGGDLHQLS